MSFPTLAIEKSYPFNWNTLTADEQDMFLQLPEDFQQFLKSSNGGMLADKRNLFEYEITASFDDGREYHTSSSELEEFWGYLSYEHEKPGEDFVYPRAILHEHFDRHLAEEFLPSNVIVIGRCIQNSLIAISINKHDYGAIYYWEWYWQYPWYQDFFHTRIETAKSQFSDVKNILDNPEHPDYQNAFDALNYATLIKLAPSFSNFLTLLHEDKEGA